MSAPYRLGYNSPGSSVSLLDLMSGVQVAAGTADAITIKEGTVFITKAGVDNLTLPTPIAGLPSAGGDDGRVLLIKSTTANAHTVTTAADVINGADDTITFGGAVTDYSELHAYNGKWWQCSESGSTLSEV